MLLSAIVRSVVLGLSTGLLCMGYGAPALVPLLLGSEHRSWGQRFQPLLWFLCGRLIAYLLCGVAAGLIEEYWFHTISAKTISGIYILLGLMLLMYGGMKNFPELKLCHRLFQHHSGRNGYFVLGLLLGFNLCPPFIAAFSDVLIVGRVSYGLVFSLLLYGHLAFFPPFRVYGYFFTKT